MWWITDIDHHGGEPGDLDRQLTERVMGRNVKADVVGVSQGMFLRALLLLVLASVSVGESSPAQSSLRMWSYHSFDTDAYVSPTAAMDVAPYATAVLRADGRLYVHGTTQGEVDWIPLLPNGLLYVIAAIGGNCGAAVRSDQSIVHWGTFGVAVGPRPTVPTLPPTVHLTRLAAGGSFLLAIRSDGQLMAWGGNPYGVLNVPAVPAGIVPVEVDAFASVAAALLSNGTILAWGSNTNGMLNVPANAPGVYYASVSVGLSHILALRSDGTIAAWGGNLDGQCNVPPLPPGMTYTHVAAGDSQSHAVRSDGQIIGWGAPDMPWTIPAPALPPGIPVLEMKAGIGFRRLLLANGELLGWGDNGTYQTQIVTIDPTQQRFTDVSAGFGHMLAVLDDGSLRTWGDDRWNAVTVPSSLASMQFTKVAAGRGHSLALRSDGQLFAWGDNSGGQCNVPALPPGMHYSWVESWSSHSVALRSDGAAVGWGSPSSATGITPPPAGVRYVDAALQGYRSLLLRSDGQLAFFGQFTNRERQVPALQSGVRFVDVAMADSGPLALRSDGQVEVWGDIPNVPDWVNPPALPAGVYYVEVDGGRDQYSLRRSDGEIVSCGRLNAWLDYTPPLEPGTSYEQVSCAIYTTAARVGPTSTYVSFAPGCAGTLPATRLVPRDTPRIGITHEVRLFDLPQDCAFMVLGWNRVSPTSLAIQGMPGCFQEISADAAVFLAGQNHQAVYELPIPDWQGLIGLRFFNQAVVLDSGTNTLGAVVSDAAEGVIGRR